MALSYNGWKASPSPKMIDIVPLVVDGVSFPPGVRSGAVHAVFTELVRRLMREVEPAGEGCWGYAYRQNRNADNLSCHASGTAIDFNAPKHPNGKRGTFSKPRVKAIEKILADLDVIAWGGHFHGTPDEMHFEIKGTPAEVAAVANRLHGHSQPAPAPTPAPTKEWDEMATKDEIKQAVAEALADSEKRIIAAAHADALVLLRGTKDGTHPNNLTNIGVAVGVRQ
jgi:hypothetical protein